MKTERCMRSGVCVLFFSLVFVVGVAIAPSGAETTAKKAARARVGKAVFDLSHGEIFSPTEFGPLNYSIFYNTFKDYGWSVGVNSAHVTTAALKGVKTYVIAGPTQEFDEGEISALAAFVEGGGNVLVLLHIAGPVAQLTESFGIIVSNFVLAEPADNVKDEVQDFYVSRFKKHPVTDGLKKIAVFGTWGLMAGGHKAKLVAMTSANAWADSNRNRVFDPQEFVQEFGIIGVAGLAKGKFVVVADDAPFANKFITVADNGRLAENIIRWFGK